MSKDQNLPIDVQKIERFETVQGIALINDQISDISQNITKKELSADEIRQLQNELHRNTIFLNAMRKKVDTLTNENEQQRKTIIGLENRLNQEAKEENDDDISTLRIKVDVLDSTVKRVSSFLDKSNEELKLKEEENEQLKIENSQLEENNSQLNEEIQEICSICDDLQQEVAHLRQFTSASDHERRIKALVEQNEKLEQENYNLRMENAKTKIHKEEIPKSYYENKVAEMEVEIDELKLENEDLQSQIQDLTAQSSEVSSLRQLKVELKMKIKDLKAKLAEQSKTQEIESLTNLTKQLQLQLDAEKKNYYSAKEDNDIQKRVINEMNQELKDSNRIISELKQSYQEVSQNSKYFDTEKEELKTSLEKIKLENNKFAYQVKELDMVLKHQMETENEFSEFRRTKNKEINLLETKIKELEMQIDQSETEKINAQMMFEKITQETIQNCSKLQDENQQLSQEMHELKLKISNSNQTEIEELRSQIKEKDIQINQVVSENDELSSLLSSAHILKLTEVVSQINQNLTQMTQENMAIKHECKELQKELELSHKDLEEQIQENERLVEEIDMLSVPFDNNEAAENLQSKISELTNEINKKDKQIETLTNQVHNLQNSPDVAKELDKTIDELNETAFEDVEGFEEFEDIDREEDLQNEVVELKQEIEDLKNELNEARYTINQLLDESDDESGKEMTKHDLIDVIKTLLKEAHDKEETYQNMCREWTPLKKTVRELEKKLEDSEKLIRKEKQRLIETSSDYEAQICTIFDKVKQFNEIKNGLMQKVRVLEAENSAKDEQIRKLREDAAKFKQHLNEMSKFWQSQNK